MRKIIVGALFILIVLTEANAAEMRVGMLRDVQLICNSSEAYPSSAAVIVDWNLETKYLVTVATNGISKTYEVSSIDFLNAGYLKKVSASSGSVDESGNDSITIKYANGKYKIDGTINGLAIVPSNYPNMFVCQSFATNRD